MARSGPQLIALSADGSRGGGLAPCPAKLPLHRVTPQPTQASSTLGRAQSPSSLCPPPSPTQQDHPPAHLLAQSSQKGGKGGAGSEANKLAHHVSLIWNEPQHRLRTQTHALTSAYARCEQTVHLITSHIHTKHIGESEMNVSFPG